MLVNTDRKICRSDLQAPHFVTFQPSCLSPGTNMRSIVTPHRKDRSATWRHLQRGPDTAHEHAISLAVSRAFRQFPWTARGQHNHRSSQELRKWSETAGNRVQISSRSTQESRFRAQSGQIQRCYELALAESAKDGVWIINTIAGPERFVDHSASRNRITVNPDHSHKSFPVRVRWEQGGEHGSARSHQGPPGPPDVKAVRSREGSHRRAFPKTLDSQGGDRQPALNQADVRHGFLPLTSGRRMPMLQGDGQTPIDLPR